MFATQNSTARTRRLTFAPLAIAAALLTLGITTPAPAQDADEVKVLFNGGGNDGQRMINQGKFDEAADFFRAKVEGNPADGRSWFFLGYALHGAGRLTEALPVHLMAAEWPQGAPTARYNAACIYSLWGQNDKAFEWIGKAMAAGFNSADTLRTDTDMDNIREDPRFDALLAKLTNAGTSAATSQPAAVEKKTDSPSGDTPGDVERHFDFWVGDWDVYNTKGQKVGANTIDKRLDGQLIFESWTSAGGGQGQSMNFYDPIEGAWRQVWVSQFGDVIEYKGGFKNGAMRFKGTYRVPGKPEEIAKSSFTPRADGSVHQFIEHSRDQGETWYTYFDGIYVKKGSTPPAITTTGVTQ